MRLLLDEHISTAVARELYRRGHDVLTTIEAGLVGSSDTELVAWAIDGRRVIVTADRGFRRKHESAISGGEQTWGLIMLARHEWTTAAAIGRLVRALDELLRAHPAEDALLSAERWLPWSLD